MQRRSFLLGMLTLIALAPLKLWAALWNKPAFEAVKINDVSKYLNINAEISSQDIVIIAPDRAENGAIVQVEVQSKIENTEAIAILVEHNPTPLIANFMFSNGAEPFVITRIKMAETSDLKVVVKAGTQYFTRSKNITVLENGCG
ncbi:thiosulfate oxidation carrier protein SoxY [Methylotenera mobilis]|uniref:Transmembrane proetin, twin-arginine translocation pathway signal n=1 Tax=Methylotenera mobilis (strain JLW8 / ATCC BAA-1282 / DSM 17540) TaxID=583345 RepID=C6WT70_METML|nr:thiosulfate oxidation carrier protein SoxY [Methylotenera mobilis]ACT49132.1 transmembrane proetin, twin-arginine translocation pathway signal [Methylotenera mobilis JLW8]